ncbi:hypothetical protein AB833_20170 [Chromatiales bacterium (ex Bugula neritina AB1)]|nr:hypothetical protein AB833_20170 [Chromatiales bacterium (ex Bugula neritina AB1)]
MIKWVLGIFFGAILLTTAWQLVPVYVQNHTLSGIVEEVIADQSLKNSSKREVVKAISGQFSQNNLSHLNAADVIKVARDDNGKLVVDVKYEERRNLLYNLAIVAGFDEQYTN